VFDDRSPIYLQIADGIKNDVLSGALKGGIGMFVSPDARERLRADRRQAFFTDVVDPMLAEAKRIGIEIDEIVRHLGGPR
jgi:GntR family transcriptional regulator